MSLKVAVIGVGSMGRNHARIYWELPDVTLVGVSDPAEETVKSIASKYGTNAYTDYQKMLDIEKPDAVTISVPTVFHKDIALEVIDRKISLLIEKPIAYTIEEAEEIIKAAELAGVKLMIGHIERFNSAIMALKQKLKNKELGRIFQIDAHRQGPFPARIGDVGVVIDLAVHDLDIMRYISEREIIRVYAETERRIHSKYEDLLTGLVRMDDASIGTLKINWLTPTKIRELFVTGEGGMYKVDYLTQDLYFYENSVTHSSEWETMQILRGVNEGQMVRTVIPKKEPLRAEQEAFLNSVMNDKPVPTSGQDGLKALKLAQALVTSGIKHEVIQT